ncbi:MAG: ABC transporter ATP-binding protein/permease [Clostridium sp.]
MIKIKNLTKSYGESNILNSTDYTFSSRGLVCLLGPSGCGKSSLLNLVAGFDTDYTGEIVVGDTILSGLKSDELCKYRKDNVGFIFQDYHLISGYTVLDNLLLPCDLFDTSYEENLKKAEDILEKLGIKEKMNEKIENLSGGQKQRVSIARALMKNPKVLLADEPTGALDRSTSNEIMKMLQMISKDILVVVITHDKKVASYANTIIAIEDRKIVEVETGNNEDNISEDVEVKSVSQREKTKIDTKSRGRKNFKIHFKRLLMVAIAVSLGVSAFMLSLSSQDIMKSSIAEFKEKNSAFNEGYVKTTDVGKYKEAMNLLSKDNRVIDSYYQYKVKDVELSLNDKKEKLIEYIPMPKTSESLSYGVMPKSDKDQIALTLSTAKKLSSDISKVVGKTITFKVGNYTKELVVSGVYNAGYDGVLLSSKVEKELYSKVDHDKNAFSVSYSVNNFEDVSFVSDMLAKAGIDSVSAKDEVNSLINTFSNVNRLFLVVSVLIFLVGLFISVVLLYKLQNSRIKEIGLLSALGFSSKNIKDIVLHENVMLSGVSVCITLVLITISYLVSKMLNIPLSINGFYILISVIGTFAITYIVSVIVSHKLIKIEPAKALKG